MGKKPPAAQGRALKNPFAAWRWGKFISMERLQNCPLRLTVSVAVNGHAILHFNGDNLRCGGIVLHICHFKHEHKLPVAHVRI
jgi:hypothetical protein